MNANTSWKPRVILQDAVAVGLNGEVSPLVKAGVLSMDSLLLLNRHELTPEGVKQAAEYTRDHRIHAVARVMAEDLPTLSHQEFNKAIGIAPPGQGAPTDNLYQAFLDKPEREREQSVYATLTRTLNHIIAEPEKTLDRIIPQTERFKGGIRSFLVAAVDQVESTMFPARQNFFSPESGSAHREPSLTGANTRAEARGGLLGSLMGAYQAAYEAVVPGFLQRALERVDNALFSALETVARPVMNGLRDMLTTQAPILENGEALVKAAEQAIEQSVPERLKPLYANLPTPPVILVGHNPSYGLQSYTADGANHIGFASTTERAIWIHTDIAAKPGHIAREELEHIANAAVGMDVKQFSHAAQHDLNSPSAQAFVKQEAQHNWHKNYKPENWGMELLNDANRCFDRLCKTMPPEKAFDTIEKSLPEFGKLFRSFRGHEADYIGELVERAAATGRADPSQEQAAQKGTAIAPDESKAPGAPPRHLPKDYVHRDSAALSALGKGNTSTITPDF